MSLALPGISELAPTLAPPLGKVTISTKEASTIEAVAAPAKALKRRPRKKRAPEFLQHEELEALFHAIKSTRDRAIFELAYRHGLRASEVGRLMVRDYNQRTERLMIHRLKGSNSGEHALNRVDRKLLKAWLKIRGNAPGPIFLSSHHSPISRQMLDVLMKEYGAAAGIPPKLRHFHILKHTCATHLLELGERVEDVQDWIGHANIQNTMLYAHITNRQRDAMASRLEHWR